RAMAGDPPLPVDAVSVRPECSKLLASWHAGDGAVPSGGYCESNRASWVQSDRAQTDTRRAGPCFGARWAVDWLCRAATFAANTGCRCTRINRGRRAGDYGSDADSRAESDYDTDSRPFAREHGHTLSCSDFHTR